MSFSIFQFEPKCCNSVVNRSQFQLPFLLSNVSLCRGFSFWMPEFLSGKPEGDSNKLNLIAISHNWWNAQSYEKWTNDNRTICSQPVQWYKCLISIKAFIFSFNLWSINRVTRSTLKTYIKSSLSACNMRHVSRSFPGSSIANVSWRLIHL